MRGETTNQRLRIPNPAVHAITIPIGAALLMPSTPTIGEISPAVPKLIAPSSEAAVPAYLP